MALNILAVLQDGAGDLRLLHVADPPPRCIAVPHIVGTRAEFVAEDTDILERLRRPLKMTQTYYDITEQFAATVDGLAIVYAERMEE